MPARFAALVAFAGLPAVGFAQIQLISQVRQLSVDADYETTGGTHENSQQESAAPGYGAFTDSLSVDTGASAASAAMDSLVSRSILSASGSAHAQTIAPNVSEHVYAAALTTYVVDFQVDRPTPVHFHAAIPTANPAEGEWNVVQNTWILFNNLSTGRNIAHVRAAYNISPQGGPEIEPPVDLAVTLQPGQYEIQARFEESGAGSQQPFHIYYDDATFELSLILDDPCYPNCDGSTTPPVLNINDFQCFLNAFAAGNTYANCDGSTTPPVLTVNDFQCFMNSFAAGCS